MIDVSRKYLRIEQKKNGVYIFILCREPARVLLAEKTSDLMDAKSRARKFANIVGNCPIWLIPLNGVPHEIK